VADSVRRRRRESDRAAAGPESSGRARLKGVPASGSTRNAGHSYTLDAVLHHRMRLGMVSALAGTSALTFVELRALLQTTDGNLSVHARKLEDAGYVSCWKSFSNRRPRTEYRLAAAGRRALERYLDHMEAVIDATRRTLDR
jgi:DNA-binding transcriptional ArsR family regulator